MNVWLISSRRLPFVSGKKNIPYINPSKHIPEYNQNVPYTSSIKLLLNWGYVLTDIKSYNEARQFAAPESSERTSNGNNSTVIWKSIAYQINTRLTNYSKIGHNIVVISVTYSM